MIAPDLIYHRALIGKYHALLYEIQGNDVFVDLIIDLRQRTQIRLM
jgi:DNA-binding GntR family transcriptional regulator